VIRYFVARGETARLDDAARATLGGSFVRLSGGVTQYELTGSDDGELIVLIPGITIPLSYWDGLAWARSSRWPAWSAIPGALAR
jgi:hypothetical protein